MSKNSTGKTFIRIINRFHPNTIASFITMVLFIIFGRIFHYPVFIFIIIFLALFIHEAGHYLAAKYYGYKDVILVILLPFGGMVKGTKEVETFKEKLIVALAGPVPGILLGYLLFGIYSIFNVPMLKTVSMVFLLFNGFNLLPVHPLDGSKILRILFARNIRSLKVISFLSVSTMLFFLIVAREPLAGIIFIIALADLILSLGSGFIIREQANYVVMKRIIRNNLLRMIGYRRGDVATVFEGLDDIAGQVNSIILSLYVSILLTTICFIIFQLY